MPSHPLERWRSRWEEDLRAAGLPSKLATRMTLKHCVPAVLISLFVLITASSVQASVTYRPITPSEIPGNTVQAELGTEEQGRAHRLFRSFQEQPSLTAGTSTQTLHAMPAAPTANDEVLLKNGQHVDALALYLFINAVEKALNKQGKTLRDPNLTKVNLDSLSAFQVPSYGSFRLQIPREGIDEAVPQPEQTRPPGAPEVASFSAACATQPAKVDLDKAWGQIGQILDGKTLDRCSLDFAPKLDIAESSPPVVPNNVTVASLTLGDNDSRNYAQAYLHQQFTYNAGNLELEFTSTLQGAFLGRTLTIGSIDAKVSAPKLTQSTEVVAVKLGDTTAYYTSGTWKDLTVNVLPDKATPILDPWSGSFQLAPGVNAHFEINALAKYGLNGRIKTYKTAAYLDFKPRVEIDIKGAADLTAIIVSGGLDGNLALVSGDGEFGGVAAIFADTTRSQSSPPLVAVVGPIASYGAAALQGELRAHVRLALVGTVFSKKILTWNGRKLADRTLPTFWSAYAIAQ